MKTNHDRAEIIRAFTALVLAGQVTELRALDATRPPDRWPTTWSGYFDDPERLADAVLPLMARGIYIIPNQVNPDLLARAANRARAIKTNNPTTNDNDIIRRRWLLVDCDPVRAADISATDAEHAAALACAERIKTWMIQQGWPAPALGDSGNGGHVLARVDLPADDGGLVARCLAALAAQFGTAAQGGPAVKVDTSVGNPARIWKLYGTLACKGDNTPSRPHRLARLLELSTAGVVSVAQLEALASMAPQAQPAAHAARQATTRPGQDFTIEAWAAAVGLALPESKPWQNGGKKWVLPVCPMNPAHTDRAAFIAQLPSGAISAGCQHDSCSWDWAELRRKYEPERQVVMQRNGTGAPANYEEPVFEVDFAPLTSTDHDAPTASGPDVGRAGVRGALTDRLQRVEFVNAAELVSRAFPDQKWAIDGILPTGTYILAGRPKVGKSWLALSLAIAVASGGKALGHAATTQGDVLYLGLEDSYRRMQTRICKLLNGDGATAVERLALVTECPRLNDGGELILSKWLDEHQDARLVVIDTLQRFRPRRRRGGDGYEDDYEALQPILTETKRRDITIVVVHHLRKLAGGDDVFDMVSGTLGLTGAVDGTMVLQRVRGKPDATLHVVGRDLPDDLELGLGWDAQTATWRVTGSARDLLLTQAQFVVISALRDEDQPLSLKDLHDILKRNRLDMTYDAAKMMLVRMVEAGQLWKAGHGLYAMADQKT